MRSHSHKRRRCVHGYNVPKELHLGFTQQIVELLCASLRKRRRERVLKVSISVL